MHDLYDDLMELCETLTKEAGEANEKIRTAGGKLSAGDLEYIDKLTHAIKSVKTTIAMMDSGASYDGSYDNSYNDSYDNEGGMSNAYRGNHSRNRSYENSGRMMGRNSYARGRSARRDSMGRYSRDNADMVEELRELMEKSPNEEARREFQKFITKMESM